ncbi:four helix bundle protein [Patescibacteria group bacterium]|nr:four helix bundle protein [Patescibacteria group bacterium]
MSRSDFRNKIHICKKEAQESHYWLKLLGDCVEPESSDIGRLILESKVLTLIFGKITSTMKTSKEKFNNKK